MNRIAKRVVSPPTATRNDRTGHWRVPWKSLDRREREKRYHRSLVAFSNGVRKTHPGTFAEFTHKQRALDAHQQPSIVPKCRTKRISPPPFFGSVARTEVLLLLSTNGPLHVREIARLRGADSAGTFRSIERLQAAGLVAKRNHGRRIVALDRSHRAYPRLQAFLLELAREFPPPRIDVQSYRHGLPLPYEPHAVANEDNLFGQVAKTRTLLAVAALEPINLAGVASAVQTPHINVWHAAKALERHGLLVSERVGRDRILRLSKALPAFPRVSRLSAHLD